jgi:hypothetical protein
MSTQTIQFQRGVVPAGGLVASPGVFVQWVRGARLLLATIVAGSLEYRESSGKVTVSLKEFELGVG